MKENLRLLNEAFKVLEIKLNKQQVKNEKLMAFQQKFFDEKLKKEFNQIENLLLKV